MLYPDCWWRNRCDRRENELGALKALCGASSTILPYPGQPQPDHDSGVMLAKSVGAKTIAGTM
jgi:hypothetical protein